MKTFVLLALALSALGSPAARGATQDAAAPPPAAQTAVAPFVATYEAWYQGKLAGDASMRVEQVDGPNWRVSLDIHGRRGFVGLARVNIEQSTDFDVYYNQFRPLRQETVRRALMFSRRATGVYDWHARSAQWTGDISKRRRDAVPLQDGDMSTLLINLAVMRDAEPGATLHYRFVDGGRAREHEYRVSQEREIVEVGDLSYNALRVSRVENDQDEMIIWVAEGVPTPVRILQLDDDGTDTVDLRLTEYQGVP